MECDLINPEQKKRMLELAIKALDGDLSLPESKELETSVSSSKALAAYYSACIKLHLGMVELEAFQCIERETDNTGIDQALWEMMAIHERTAPGAEVPHELPKQDIIHKVERKRVEYKIPRSSLFTIAASIAAMVLVILFVRYTPPKGGVEVATLADSINAVWADMDVPMENGKRIAAGSKRLLLREGLAKLIFDNQTEVTLEAPAEFEIPTDDQIRLRYGRLYAIVPQEAIGFTINTQTTRIIDLGTEFGVQADSYGDTALHVVKGKTVLIAGDKSNKVSVEVTRGIAKKVSAQSQSVSDISYDESLFARTINSADQLVWRGQMKVQLADIVGGGNGFGTGRKDVGIDPASGKLVQSLLMRARVEDTGRYSSVPENPCIDGVFVPFGGQHPQVVTSRGDVFHECPETDGRYWIEITNQPITGFEGEPESIRLARLNGIEYGTDTHSAIMMHANTGITFDLKAIRAIIPNLRISRFTASCGLSESLSGTSLQNDASADMWVLVDGQPREKVHVDFSDISHAVMAVSIDDTDRFLTLVSSSDWNAGDWTLYGDPVLELELYD